MPKAPPRPCTKPGCPAYATERSRCDQHQVPVDERFRKSGRSRWPRTSAASRGYDAAWRRLREAKLSADPFCQCDECTRTGALLQATVVDHIIPISERPDLRLEWDNLRSMTKAHHDRRTLGDAARQASKGRKKF